MMAASSDALPKAAINKIVAIVDALAEDVIFGDGDLETAMYFCNMLNKVPARIKLAQIAVEVRKDKPEWSRINLLLDNLIGGGVVEVPERISTFAALQLDAHEMLLIPRIEPKRLKKYLALVSSTYNEDKAKVALKKLMQAHMDGKEKEVLESPPFSHAFMLEKYNKWLQKACGEPVPTPRSLLGKRKRPEPKQQLKALRRARKELSHQVVDPLEEIRLVAQQARRAGEDLYEKKKSAKRLDFADSDDDDDEEIEDPDAHGTHELSEAPKRWESPVRRNSPKKRRTTPGSAKRKKWTNAQKRALKSAVDDYGVGNWAAIRDCPRYRQFWEGRGSDVGPKLKDLWRTMVRRGEVQEGAQRSDDEEE